MKNWSKKKKQNSLSLCRKYQRVYFSICILEGFPKIQNLEFIKEKIDRLFCTKIINVYMTEDSINKVKRQVKEILV